MLPLVSEIGTARFRRAVVDTLSLVWGNLRKLRDLVDIMTQTSIDIFEEKKTAMKQGDEALEKLAGHGKDIISILCGCFSSYEHPILGADARDP